MGIQKNFFLFFLIIILHHCAFVVIPNNSPNGSLKSIGHVLFHASGYFSVTVYQQKKEFEDKVIVGFLSRYDHNHSCKTIKRLQDELPNCITAMLFSQNFHSNESSFGSKNIHAYNSKQDYNLIAYSVDKAGYPIKNKNSFQTFFVDPFSIQDSLEYTLILAVYKKDSINRNFLENIDGFNSSNESIYTFSPIVILVEKEIYNFQKNNQAFRQKIIPL